MGPGNGQSAILGAGCPRNDDDRLFHVKHRRRFGDGRVLRQHPDARKSQASDGRQDGRGRAAPARGIGAPMLEFTFMSMLGTGG